MSESTYQETDVVPVASKVGGVKSELPASISSDDSVAAASPPVPHLVLRPGSAWKLVDLAEVWYFRDLLFSFAGRDLKLRYKQTALGIIWVVLQPLLAAGIFTFVFGFIAKIKNHGIPMQVLIRLSVLAKRFHASKLAKEKAIMGIPWFLILAMNPKTKVNIPAASRGCKTTQIMPKAVCL